MRPASLPREFLRRLDAAIAGDVLSDRGVRSLYASDASNYRIPPAAVVAPHTGEDVQVILAACSAEGVPVTMRGAGTSVAGNACGPGVLVDTSRYLTRILDIDTAARTATVEPGVILDDVNRRAATSGLRVGPDPSTHSRATVGGMIGNNACGPRSIRWGTTADNVASMIVALADGTKAVFGPASITDPHAPCSERGRQGDIARRLRDMVRQHEDLIRSDLTLWSRRISGYALEHLLPDRGFDIAKTLVGTEGTCAVTMSATLRLVDIPRSTTLLVIPFLDDVAAARSVLPILEESPLTVEGMTAALLGSPGMGRVSGILPSGGAWLLVEAFGASPAESQAHALRLVAASGVRNTRIIDDPPSRALLWRVREESAGRATRLPDGTAAWPGLEDAAVPPSQLAGYLTGFHTLLADHGLQGTTFGHFGEGCLHTRIDFDLSEKIGVERFTQFMSEAADLIVSHGGSLSGEHGDGRARSALLPHMYQSSVLDLFAQFKAIWDPQGILNPGIVVDPEPIDVSLRPATPTAIEIQPQLAFSADRGDFRSAVQRCVGIGKCITRRHEHLMCPSFQATRREQDSTRGRARLLQEMLTGDPISDGWKSTAVLDALDLCLSCKGCVADCPANVDMAAYKSEFLYHHYRRRPRPRPHYSLGWLPLWLRMAEFAPRLSNLVLHNPFTRHAVAALAGISRERALPSLARVSFLRRTRDRRPSSQGTRGTVLLWPDTFNNHFSPEVLEAGAELLAAADFGVRVPDERVCCGLTWTTTGQLDHARRVLLRTLSVVGDDPNPVIVLEPSCAAALRHDLPELLPEDARAHRLAARVRTLSEVLVDAPIAWNAGPKSAPSPAIVQTHCHQQALLETEPDLHLLELAGISVVASPTGCCGLAGNFGMERGHEDIAQSVAEIALIPALQQADESTLVIADGFSCRTQISHVADRQAQHLAEVLAERLGPD